MIYNHIKGFSFVSTLKVKLHDRFFSVSHARFLLRSVLQLQFNAVIIITVATITKKRTYIRMACCYKYNYFFLHSHFLWRRVPFPLRRVHGTATAGNYSRNFLTPKFLLSSRSQVSKVTHLQVIINVLLIYC